MADPKVDFLRHTLATLAYRGGRAVRNAPADFGDFTTGNPPKKAVDILSHIGDLLEWSVTIADGQPQWRTATALSWEQEVNRFFMAMNALDNRLQSGSLACAPEKIFQGPIADALTHVGQIKMLRRLANCSPGSENYYLANIEAGRLGQDQSKPVKEFA